MKKYIFLFFLALTSFVSAQQKYFVYFKNKSISENSPLLKSSLQFLEARDMLSRNSIERRKKILGDDYISFEDLPLNTTYVNSLKAKGASIVWELKWFNAVSGFIKDENLAEIISLPFVDRIEKVRNIKFKDKLAEQFYNASLNKSTDSYKLNYGVSLAQNELSEIPVLHDNDIAGDGVRVALLDAGFIFDNHRVFDQLKVIATRDFVYGDANVGNDGDATHGTQVLSTIAGFDNGNLIGPAYKSEFLLAKTENINLEANIEEDNFAAGVEWAEANGADIISTSLGYNQFDAGQQSYTYSDMDGKSAVTTIALEKAFNKGVITISSAGNEGNDPWKFITSPADGKNTIAVGAVNELNKVAPFSSRGPTFDGRIKPEVVAMGVNCYVASLAKDQYQFVSGTSLAAPIMAGIAAQLLSVYPHLTNAQVRDILIESGDNLDKPDNDRGYGLVSAKRAVMFPNLKSVNNNYAINKLLFPSDQIDLQSIQILELLSGDQETITSMTNIDGFIFSHQFNGYSIGDTVKIRFRYKDSDGVEHIEPENKYYKFIYGTKKISLGTDVESLPKNFVLSQNFPNPFNSETTFKFDLTKNSQVSLKIYNILGQHIITLADEFMTAGKDKVITWNGLNNNGIKVGSGAYIYQLRASGFVASKKMILLK